MKIVTYLHHINELERLDSSVVNEVILSSKELSRLSLFSKDEIVRAAHELNRKKIHAVLEWDILSTEEEFQSAKSFFTSLPLELFSSVRLQDPGVIHFVKKHYPWLKVQLVLETANHNLISCLTWKNYLGDQLQRVVLSLELSREHLKTFVEKLAISCEVMALGPILLFYSPRKLLSARRPDEKLVDDKLKAWATSEESPHSGFFVEENKFGTFMLNTKDHCLLEHWDELKSFGVDYVRVDLRLAQEKNISEYGLHLEDKGEAWVKKAKELYGRAVIKGFYNVNKSDVLFPKLKNSRIQRRDQNYVGEILHVEKEKFLVAIIKSSDNVLKSGMKLKLITPEGKIKYLDLHQLQKVDRTQIDEAKKDDLILLSFLSGVTTKTQLYLES